MEHDFQFLVIWSGPSHPFSRKSPPLPTLKIGLPTMWLLSPGLIVVFEIQQGSLCKVQSLPNRAWNNGSAFFNGRNSINGLNPGGENVQPTKKVELFLKAPSVFSLVYQVGHLIPWFLTWMIQKNRLKNPPFSSLGSGFKKSFIFNPIVGEMIEFGLSIFFRWLESTN